MSLSTKVKRYFDRTPAEWRATLVSYVAVGFFGSLVLCLVGTFIALLVKFPVMIPVIVGIVVLVVCLSNWSKAEDTLSRRKSRLADGEA